MADTAPCSTLGAEGNPLIIDDDDGADDITTRIRRIEEEVRIGRALADWVSSRDSRHHEGSRSLGSTQSGQPHENDSEEAIEAVLVDGIADIIDLTDDDCATQAIVPPVPGHAGRAVPTFTLDNGTRLRAGITIELKSPLGIHGIQFLRIQSLVQTYGSRSVQIRGWGYARTRQLRGMLPCKLNEVVLVADVQNSDPRAWEEQALVDVPTSAVKRVRELRVTNAPFPEHRYEPSAYSVKGRRWVEERGPLVCRYQYTIHFNGAGKKPCEWALARICESDADPEYRMLDEHILNRWRGGKVPGGSYKPDGSVLPVFDLDTNRSNNARPSTPSPGQRYTAGDVFAGAGGASRGIERAGVRLLFALDHWNCAVQSLASNFTKSDIYNMEVTDFILSKDIQYHVDILHLSPPCQFWSPAHTVAGKDDEHNIAVLFACTHLIEKFRPRLFTIEQTFGILSPRFKAFFNLFVDGFTRHGYSIRWKAVPLANYGVPQMRRRLIMIGSAPGERLPPLPPPTHSKDGVGGLKPWATPKSVLAPLARIRHHELHQPERSRQWEPPKPQWDPNNLAKTITTNGGQNYHWSGTRDFTLLEYAVLQGFPIWHKFQGNYIKKQIGNAFAPSVVKVLYDHLVTWLLRQDGFDPSARATGPLAVDLDLSQDDDDAIALSSSGDEIICLGSRATQPPRSISIRDQPGPTGASLRRGQAARGDAGIADHVAQEDGRSDTETLVGDDDRYRGRDLHREDIMDVDLVTGVADVIDLTVGNGRGTMSEPWELPS
ncbi:hypothetical protein MFIFM68171_02332 [Madurella fahalii]|uniref:DNA (cytosine-5-)-methyltransferase n=1 Tax=Madurella fahalii TaxID=1157608 RepID=A0ABQ0G322_9PEZI